MYIESGRAGNEFKGDCYESHLDDGESRSPHDEHQDLSEEKIWLQTLLEENSVFNMDFF